MAADVSLVMTLDDQGRIQLGKISKEYNDVFENLKNDVNKRLGGIQQSINNMNAAFNNRPTILRYAESFGTGLRTMIDTARTGFTSIGSYVSRFLFGSKEQNELGHTLPMV